MSKLKMPQVRPVPIIDKNCWQLVFLSKCRCATCSFLVTDRINNCLKAVKEIHEKLRVCCFF